MVTSSSWFGWALASAVFAALTAWALLGERMGLLAMGGAALVVAALVWTATWPRWCARRW